MGSRWAPSQPTPEVAAAVRAYRAALAEVEAAYDGYHGALGLHVDDPGKYARVLAAEEALRFAGFDLRTLLDGKPGYVVVDGWIAGMSMRSRGLELVIRPPFHIHQELTTS